MSVVRGVCFLAMMAAIPYAVIGWQHMAIGDGLLLDCTVTRSADVPPSTVILTVVDAEGWPVPRAQVRLFNTSGGAVATLDGEGRGTVSISEGAYDIEFGECAPGGGRMRLPVWTRLLRHGGFSVAGSGVHLDIRLRWSQAW